MSHFWFVMRWLHMLAMAFFVGGSSYSRRWSCPRSAKLPTASDCARSPGALATGTLVALGVLLTTGSAMAGHLHLWGDETFQVKLALVALIAILVLAHARRGCTLWRARSSCAHSRSYGSDCISQTDTAKTTPWCYGARLAA